MIIHPCGVTNIPPESRIPQLSLARLKICINPFELFHPSPKPVLTVEDFMQCVNKTNHIEQEREHNLQKDAHPFSLTNHGFPS